MMKAIAQAFRDHKSGKTRVHPVGALVTIAGVAWYIWCIMVANLSL